MNRSVFINIFVIATCLSVLGYSANDCFAQCETGAGWTQRMIAGPEPRQGHAMVFDRTRSVMVLYGGSTNPNNLSTYFDDTWEYDGQSWIIRANRGPGRRTGHAMGFDTARRETVLFGGFGNGALHRLQDTWTWNGFRWTLRSQGGPGKRNLHHIANTEDGLILMYGGVISRTTISTETWARFGSPFGSQWILNSTNGPRNVSAMGFDSTRSVFVLYSRGSSSGPETWERMGLTWRNRFIESPPSRNDSAMAFDKTRDVMVMFGGQGKNDTWEWDGVEWIMPSLDVSPPGRSRHAMAYDSARGVIVMFGGVSGGVLGDTWEYQITPVELDCNLNGVLDFCDLHPNDPDGDGVVSLDCNQNDQPDECDPNDDGDLLPDDCDRCPLSNMISPITIGDCQTNVSNDIDDEGCTMADRLEECQLSIFHPVNPEDCLDEILTQWLEEELILPGQMKRLRGCARSALQSDVQQDTVNRSFKARRR